MDNQLEALILESLRSGGPFTADELADELTNRRRLKTLPEFDGLIGVGAVKTALRSLRIQGLAKEGEGGWIYTPPARPVEVKRERVKQTTLF